MLFWFIILCVTAIWFPILFLITLALIIGACLAGAVDKIF